MKRCDWCESEYTPHPNANRRQRFCTTRCRWRSNYYERRARESER